MISKLLIVCGCLSALFARAAASPAQTAALPPEPSAGETAIAEMGAESGEEDALPGIYAGGELYLGRSNIEGAQRARDGYWATGTGPSYPSTLYLRLLTRHQVEAKVAVGIGRLFRDAAYGLEQPVEAWVRVPLLKSANTKLTVGKFYVPFALQEWQYETKWGAMLEHERGETAFAVAVAAMRNQDDRDPNIYARVGRDFGENLNIGFSFAGGEGLSYGSDYDRAFGLDFSATRNGWNLSGEQLWMKSPEGERFRFTYLCLAYEELGKLRPFAAHYNWKDSSDSFGNVRSTALGAAYQLTPELAIESGYTFTSGDDVLWAQLHWSGQRRVSAFGARAALRPKTSSQP